MEIILLVAFFLFAMGLAVGSFLNVVIYRTISGDSPMRGRSYCDSCKKPISWYDNIPVMSFIFLRGKCRHCKTPISWQYPLVETLTGVMFLWWYFVGFTFFRLSSQPFTIIQPLFWLCVGILFLIIFFTDLRYYIIPDSSVLALTFLSVIYRLSLTIQHVMTVPDFWFSVIAALGGMGFMLLLVVLTKGKGMGMGDVKLTFPLGLILGWPGILIGIYSAFVSGAIVGITLLLFKKKKMKSMLPFGPFLILGTIIALLWGEKLVTLYLQLL